MADENKHIGKTRNLVQGRVAGDVHFHDHRSRGRRRTWLVVLVCVLGLGAASVMLLIRSDWSIPSGTAPATGQHQRGAPGGEPTASPGEAFGDDARCHAPASPVRDDDNGYLTNFARTRDDAVAQNNQTRTNGSKRSDWFDIGGKAQNQPVAACDAKGRMVVLSIADGELLINPGVEDRNTGKAADEDARLREEREQWRSEGRPPGDEGFVGVPAAARDNNDNLVVVARDGSGALWAKHQRSPGGDQWSGWTELPGAPVQDDPAIYLDSAGRLRIFTLAQGQVVQALIETNKASGEWQPAKDLSSGQDPDQPSFSTTPSVVRTPSNGCLHLFAVTAEESIAMNAEVECGAETWSGWEDWGRAPAGRPFVEDAPIATLNGTGDVVVFALDSKNELWERWKWANGTDERSDWNPLGRRVQHLVDVTLDSGNLVVHGLDSHRDLYYKAQDSGDEPWKPWSKIGGSEILHPLAP